MLTTIRGTAFVLVLFVVSSAQAQERPIVSLVPADSPRWDVAAHVGWFSRNKSEIGPDWNDWYDAASFDVSGGFYWTPHVKVELDVARTTSGGVQVDEPPTVGVPYFRSREHLFTTTSVSAGVNYQFFENAWLHPFAGGGIVAIAERERAGDAYPTVIFRDALTLIVLPQPPPIDRTLTSLRPFATAGLKVYVAERVFVRTDVRVVAGSGRAEAATWRGGFGFDF